LKSPFSESAVIEQFIAFHTKMTVSLKEFEQVFSKLVEDIVEEISLPPSTLEWFSKVCARVEMIEALQFDTHAVSTPQYPWWQV
jgi:hypothetical protein